MNFSEILNHVDHTLLSVDATTDDLDKLCQQAMLWHTASVCISPSRVKYVRNLITDPCHVCTVIGFPSGAHSLSVKKYETEAALNDGADEIDMVINIGELKDHHYDYIANEIYELKTVCQKNILKVIIETCLLTTVEKIKMCEIVSSTGADYIKTSTGFSKGGATFEDIDLFSKHISNGVKIKAAGGITSFEDAEKFISLGADRLGTSRLVKIAEQLKENGILL